MFKVFALAAAVITAVSAAVFPRASVGTTPGQLVTGGYATYYYQYGGYGACGNINPDSAIIIALQQQRYDSSLCGQTVSITNLNKGITINAIVADMCPGCGGNANSLDLSVGAWTAIGQSEADGSQVPITWTLLGGSGTSPTTTTTTTTTIKATTTTTTTTKATSTSTTTAPATTTTAASSGSCAGVAAWSSAIAYTGGQEVTYGGALWQANWWTEADVPGGIAGSWTKVATC